MTVTAMSVTLAVEGMKCGACERHVRVALKAAPGVQEASVSLPDGLATVLYDPSRLTPDYLIAAVRQSGYGARIAEASSAAKAPDNVCGCGAME
jgi:copper chaperone CopZ